MVRSSYPLLLNRSPINFATTRFVSPDRASLLIYLNSGDRLVPAIYAFIKERDGWKIEGVEFIRSISAAPRGLQTQT